MRDPFLMRESSEEQGLQNFTVMVQVRGLPCAWSVALDKFLIYNVAHKSGTHLIVLLVKIKLVNICKCPDQSLGHNNIKC